MLIKNVKRLEFLWKSLLPHIHYRIVLLLTVEADGTVLKDV